MARRHCIRGLTHRDKHSQEDKRELFKMWKESNLLLLAAVVVLTLKGTAEGAKVLDMAPDAVDYMYTGCREKAWEKFIDSGLLKQELDQSVAFQKAWSTNGDCRHVIPGRRQEHTTALSAYANGDKTFVKTFDDAVQTQGTNESTYDKGFQFKSLHFLLMDSMTDNRCKTVYYLTQDYTATNGSDVRFGHFIIAYSSYSDLSNVDWEGMVFFNITSCFFVDLGQNICSNEDIVLLSPAEEFTVEDVNVKIDYSEAEYTEITLKPRKRLNSLDSCNMLSRSPSYIYALWLLLPLVVLALVFIYRAKTSRTSSAAMS